MQSEGAYLIVKRLNISMEMTLFLFWAYNLMFALAG